jgi:heat shock protein HslJ
MRQIHRVARATLAATLLLSLAGGASAQSPAASPAAPTLANTSWELISTGTGGTQTPVPAGVTATLQIDGTLVGGNGGCNGYFGQVTSMDPGLTFGDLASTMMACPEPQMSFETAYLAALGTVTDYAIADQTLSLLDGSGNAVLVYQAAAPATVEGAWVVTGYNTGTDAVTTPPVGIELTADFSPDGHVSGNGGCNTFNGGYSYTATTIAIGPLMSTMMSCGDATDSVEQQYTAALQNATVWSITNGALELRDGAGALQVSFMRP